MQARRTVRQRRKSQLTGAWLAVCLVLPVLGGRISANPTPYSATATTLPPAQIVSGGTHHRRWIALTFDAGSDTGYAGKILHTLEQAGIHATFGLTGKWALANPTLVRKMVADGDQIVNHSYDHTSFTGYSTSGEPLSTAQRASEVRRAEAAIKSISKGMPKPYFRPPYGDYDQATLKQLPQLGYRYLLLWTVDTLGWQGLSKAAILARCARLAGPSAIILMHLGSGSRDALALSSVIAKMRSRSYRFVTVSEMVNNRL